MAVYKVIQDVEAEDKLVGPLTLRQFIYAAIAGVLIFINFKLLLSSNLGLIRWVFIFIFSLPMMLFGVLAAPLGRDQPTELWLLSHLKFMLAPRKRIWDQDGITHNVTITAPKQLDQHLTKDLSQGEVESRLQSLAKLLDSRGWAIQSTPLYTPPNQNFEDGDRLVSSDVLPTSAPDVDVQVGDDLLDPQTNGTAKRFSALVHEVEAQKKESLAKRIKSASTADDQTQTPTAGESQSNWRVEPISLNVESTTSPIVKPDETALSIDGQSEPEPTPDLNERLKAAEAQWQQAHPDEPTSPLDAERQRRAQAKLDERNTRLVNSGNFTVATLAGLAARDAGQVIKSMPL